MIEQSKIRHPESADPPPLNARELFVDLLDPRINKTRDQIILDLRTITQELRSRAKELPEWQDVCYQLIKSLDYAYRSTITTILKQPKRYDYQHDFHRLFLENFNKKQDIPALLQKISLASSEQLVRVDSEKIELDFARYPLLVASLLLMLIVLLFPDPARAQEDDPPPTPETLLQDPELAASQEAFELGFYAGQNRTPYLLWNTYQQNPDGTPIQENIFEDLITLSGDDRDAETLDQVLLKYSITDTQAIEILTGYTYGVLFPSAESPDVLEVVSFNLHYDLEQFKLICGTQAAACYEMSTANIHYYYEFDPLDTVSHENDHGLFPPYVFEPSSYENTQVTINGVNLNFAFFIHGGPGVVLSTPDNKLGVFDLYGWWEAHPEVTESVVTNTSGDNPIEVFYTVGRSYISFPETYDGFIDILVNDPSRHEQLTTLLADNNLPEFIAHTGHIVLEVDPDYIDSMFQELEINDRDTYSLLFFNLQRYQTIELLQELPPEYQAGLLFWGELSSLARLASVNLDQPDRYTSTMTPYVGYDGVVEFEIEQIDQIVTEQIEENLKEEITSYEWGTSLQEVGTEQAQAWLEEVQETGTIVLGEYQPQTIITALLELHALESTVPVTDADITKLGQVIDNLEINFDETNSNELPYRLLEINNVGRYARVDVEEDPEVTIQVTTSPSTWVHDSLQAVFRGLFAEKFERARYDLWPLSGIDHLTMEYRTYSHNFTLFERLGRHPDENVPSYLELSDTTFVPDLYAWLQMHALLQTPTSVLEPLVGSDLAQKAQELSRDKDLVLNSIWKEASIYQILIDLVPGSVTFTEADFEHQPTYAAAQEWARLSWSINALQQLDSSQNIPWFTMPMYVDPNWGTATELTDFITLIPWLPTYPYFDEVHLVHSGLGTAALDWIDSREQAQVRTTPIDNY